MFDARSFERNDRMLGHHAVIYQMGNSLYHKFVYERMLRRPGIVVLHDFGLAGFHHGYAHQEGVPAGHFERELRHSEGLRAPWALEHMDAWIWDEGGVQEAFAARSLPMNRRVFDSASAVLLHSPWLLGKAESLHPDHRDKLRVVPMGCSPRAIPVAEKTAIRARHNLPGHALVFGSFGILHPSKGNVETIEAFEHVLKQVPHALLIFVGKDLADGEARGRAEALGIDHRVRFLGRRDAPEFADLIAATDVGVCLRRPPTNGETSAALLDLLRHGVPTIATRTGTFGDYPTEVVRFVEPRNDRDGLVSAMLELAEDRESRGRAALAHAIERHSWMLCAKGYAAAIEAVAARRVAS